MPLPPNTVAIATGAGSGGLATYLVRWLLSAPWSSATSEGPHFVPGGSCQPLVDSAVAAVDARCADLGLPGVSSAGLFWRSLGLDRLEERWSFFFWGLLVGLFAGPVIDLLFVWKAWWAWAIARILAPPVASRVRHPLTGH